MDCDTGRVVANLNLKYINKKNNYNTWNHLIVCKQLSSIYF